MRQPKAPGTAISTSRKNGWRERFSGYRRNVTNAKLAGWIDQFAAADQDVAARVLDAVEFINTEQIEQSLVRTLNGLPGWATTKRDRQGTWRFVAFSKSAAESGNTMLHFLRSAANLGAARYNELFVEKRDLISEDLGPDDTVVFVDDFAGTGNQACTDWPDLMAELLPGEPNIYLLLVAARADACKKIQNETQMSPKCARTLRDRDNVFSNSCTYFSAEEKAVVLKYCKIANRIEPKGYGDCGLLIAFAHKAPNNSISILHMDHNNWLGLFPR